MRLYIDTSNSEQIHIKLGEKEVHEEARAEKSQKLLPTIDRLLKEINKSSRDITEIEVNLGPGSFTGLRVGISTANALGWALQVPVNGKLGLAEPVY